MRPELGQANVILKPKKAAPFFGRHPWVLDSAIDRVEGNPQDGEIVNLVAHNGHWVARGVYNQQSRIRVRLYAWGTTDALDAAFWRTRLQAALRLRERLGYTQPQGSARLVFSEGDGLSGLVVDRFADYLVVQVTSRSMAERVDEILPILVDLVHPRGITVRTDRAMSELEGITIEEGPRYGEIPAEPIFIEEHGLQYGVDLTHGQKTGFYVDQRDNRLAAARYARGRRVLDLFCYSGGFGMNAVRHGGAAEVLCIDSSQKAIALARANAELNGLAGMHFEVEDGFKALQALQTVGARFGMIVLDPPKFTRNRKRVDEALRAYHRLNRVAVDLLEPDGTLVTCSCSGSVSREDFMYMLVGVAQQSGREIQVLETRGASADHPINSYCLESEYLKCFICRVV